MVFDSGYWTIGRWAGASVRLHWTLAAFALYFSGFRFAPGVWLGYLLLVLAHEAGHAVLVRRYRYRVISVDVHGMGGVCRWQGNATRAQHITIAWGGVLAQAAIFVAVSGLLAVLDPPRGLFLAQLLGVLTTTNLWMIALNLLPIPPLDGAMAWQIVPALWERLRRRSPKPPSRSSWAAPRREPEDSPVLFMDKIRREAEERRKK